MVVSLYVHPDWLPVMAIAINGSARIICTLLLLYFWYYFKLTKFNKLNWIEL